MLRILSILVLVLGFAWPSEATAQVSAEDHCLKGCPRGAPAANTVIVRSIYALSNNPLTKFADWVAYKVSAANTTGPSRTRNWARDPGLNAPDTLVPQEYKDSNLTLGVDRGHQAPLAAFKGHADWRVTNYLSNITPQFSKLNQGPWKHLEAAVRNLAGTGVDVWVMTGPLYEWPMAKLPGTDKRHRVPSSYWKVVVIEAGAGVKASAFYFYQDTPRRANYCDHMQTVDFIEAKSGLDFFTRFSSEVALESSQPNLSADLGCN